MNIFAALQEAERAKFIVEKVTLDSCSLIRITDTRYQAEQDKKSTIVRAEGEAASAQMISDAIKNNPNFIKLRRIEASKEIAKTISRGGNKIYLPADNLLLNLFAPLG